MAETQHHPGRTISVAADELGHPVCGSCYEPVQTDDLFMLLRRPWADSWDGLCYPCARTILASALRTLDSE